MVDGSCKESLGVDNNIGETRITFAIFKYVNKISYAVNWNLSCGTSWE